MASQYNGIKLEKPQWDALRAVIAKCVTAEFESAINSMMDAARDALPGINAPAGYVVTVGTVLTMVQQVVTGKSTDAEKSLKALLADPANHAKLLAYLAGDAPMPENSADKARARARENANAAR